MRGTLVGMLEKSGSAEVCIVVSGSNSREAAQADLILP
jgi:hypothetical protein